MKDACNDASREEDGEERSQAGLFVGSVLLSEAVEPDAFPGILKREWGVELEPVSRDDREEDGRAGIVFGSVGGCLVGVVTIEAPVPNGEALEAAAVNFLWPGARAAAASHKAHLLVTVLPNPENYGAAPSKTETAVLFVKVMSSLLSLPEALGAYVCGTLVEPAFYRTFASMIHDELFPVYNLVWIGLYGTEGSISAYTYGLKDFGHREIEVLEADAEPGEIREFLGNLAAYVIEEDVDFIDGETVGYTDEQRCPVTIGEGAALPGKTCRVAFMKPSRGEPS